MKALEKSVSQINVKPVSQSHLNYDNSSVSLISAQPVNFGMKVNQLSSRVEGMMIDADNHLMLKKPQIGVANNLKSKLLQALNTLEDLRTELEEHGIMACGSAAQTYAC